MRFNISGSEIVISIRVDNISRDPVLFKANTLEIYDDELENCADQLSVKPHNVAASIQTKLESLTSKTLNYDDPHDVATVSCTISGKKTTLRISYAFFDKEIIIERIIVDQIED
jgi:hypothetical protein